MANKEKIDYLLLDIRELETLVAGMRDAEVYPVSFFGQTFDLTHKILKDLHALETAQIEMLRKQMEEHQALIQSIPPSVATPVQTVQEASITAPAPIPAKPEPVIQEQEIRQELPAEQGSIRQSDPRRASRIIPQRPVGKEKFFGFPKGIQPERSFPFPPRAVRR